MRKQSIYQLFLSLIIPLFYQQVTAAELLTQEHIAVSEEDYLGEVPQILTVSRLSQPLADAPSAVTIIDRETIRASGVVDLPEIFRLVPGMYVGANAGYVYSTNHTVSYHGMTSAYAGSMQVMINGRSVYSPLYGGVKWSELPIALIDIERIEITRGPNAASYGANAFFGAINIITQTGSETSGNTVLATHGSGRNEIFYRHAGRQDDFAYRATLGYRQDGGLDNRNDFKRTRLANMQAEFQLNLANAVDMEFGVVEGARGEGNIREDNSIFLPRTKQMNNYYGLLRWRHHVSDTSDFTLQAYHSYDRSDDETTSVPIAPLLPRRFRPFIAVDRLHIKNEIVQERTDIEAQHTFAAGNTVRAVWGGSLRLDTTKAPFYLGTNKTDNFQLQRFFGHIEWRPASMLTVNAGAMLEHNDFTGTDTSPRISLNFKPSPNHAFRLGASSALRTPTYTDEKFNDRLVIPTTLPNPNQLIYQYSQAQGGLEPEQIVSRELAYMGKIGRLQFDTRLFSDDISNIIRNGVNSNLVTTPNTLLLNTDTVDGSVNNGSAAVEGIEMQAKLGLGRHSNILLNYAHVNIRETRRNLKNNFIKSAPSNTVSMLLTHRFGQNWDASLAYYQTSKATLLGDGDPVDLIRKSDLRVARQFNQGRLKGEVTVMIENLFNNHYQEFADYNEFERKGRISVRLDF